MPLCAARPERRPEPEPEPPPPPVDEYEDGDRFVEGMDMGPTIAKAMNGELVNPYKAATEGFAMLVDSVLRPPRAEYEVAELGPIQMSLGDLRVTRTDFELDSKRVAAAAAGSGVPPPSPPSSGMCASRPQGPPLPFSRRFKLACSWWQPDAPHRPAERLPCVVYLHANCGARPAALEVLHQVLPHGYTLFALDFGACGHSDGEYLSLGYWEQEDVAAVIDHLRAQSTVSSIALWGRSMGAVTALLYACRDGCGIDAVVADSGYSHMRQLSRELVSDFTAGSVSVPVFAHNLLYSAVRKSAKKKAYFDSNCLNPIERVADCRVPVLFGVADDDDFIDPSHTQELYDACGSEKSLTNFDGDHNSQRPQSFYDTAGLFLERWLRTERGEDTPDMPRNARVSAAYVDALVYGLG